MRKTLPPTSSRRVDATGAIFSYHGVVSAGEAFLLKAVRYDRVTVYGDGSAGTIDYQTVGVERLTCPAPRQRYVAEGGATDMRPRGLENLGGDGVVNDRPPVQSRSRRGPGSVFGHPVFRRPLP